MPRLGWPGCVSAHKNISGSLVPVFRVSLGSEPCISSIASMLVRQGYESSDDRASSIGRADKQPAVVMFKKSML